MQTMIYPIQHLPKNISLGVQSETGVKEIGFNVKPWLDAWDGIQLSIWPTRPGEELAYPALDVNLSGSVLYWYPNSADTAIAGEGKVEIVGITSDKRKLSGWCSTSIQSTSLGATKDPPDGIKPYYDDIINAANDIRAGVDVAEGGLYIVTEIESTGNIKNISNRTVDEIRQAAGDGKTCLLVDRDGKVYLYYGDYDNRTGKGPLPTFVSAPLYSSVGVLETKIAQVNDDRRITRSGYATVKLPSPKALTINQDGKSITYDGSAAATIDIPTGGGGGTSFETDETLTLKDGVLSVNTADDVEQDNTLPVTSAAVYAEVGNINALLETI